MIEVVITIRMIALVAAYAIPKLLGPRQTARDVQVKTSLRNAVTAAETFYAQRGTYTGFAAQLPSLEPSLVAVPQNFNVKLAGSDGDPDMPSSSSNRIVLGSAAPGAPTATYANLCATTFGASRSYCAKVRSDAATLYGSAKYIGVAYDDAQIDNIAHRVGWSN